MRQHTPTDKDIIIHRPSVLGNPFSHMSNTLAQYKVATREDSVAKYEVWLREKIEKKDQDILDALSKIKEDSFLVCFCAPKSCHGDIIIKILEEINE